MSRKIKGLLLIGLIIITYIMLLMLRLEILYIYPIAALALGALAGEVYRKYILLLTIFISFNTYSQDYTYKNVSYIIESDTIEIDKVSIFINSSTNECEIFTLASKIIFKYNKASYKSGSYILSNNSGVLILGNKKIYYKENKIKIEN